MAPDTGSIHVAPAGDDGGDGTVDDPLATPEAARDAARDDPTEIVLHGGTYRRTSPFRLTGTDGDGGTPGEPLVVRAAEGASAELVGGVSVPGDAAGPVGDPSIRDRLPDDALEDVVAVDLAARGVDDFGARRQFGFGVDPERPPPPEVFVDGRPLVPARWPDEGFVETGAVADEGSVPRHGDGSGRGARFAYRDDRPEGWARPTDAWMHGYWHHDWADCTLRIADVDTEAGTVETAQPSRYGVAEGARYFYFDVPEELDAPGEYYLDRETGTLYLYPPAGTDLDGATVRVSTLTDPIVDVDGVDHVRLRGLTVTAGRGDGVRVDGSTDVAVTGCTVRNLAGTGLVVTDGRDCAVRDCTVEATGTGAIVLDGGDRETLSPGNNEATGNDLRRFGRRQRTYTPGVALSGVANRIARNEIHRAPHEAIEIAGNEHDVAYNEIHRVARETSDVGAIYLGRDWTERGTRIRYNHVHHVRGLERGVGQMAIYLDDMASGTVVRGNLVHDVNRAIMVGGGRDNRVTNNLAVGVDEAMQFDARGLGWAAYHCEDEDGSLRTRLRAIPSGTAPWRSRYPELGTLLDDEPCAPTGNTVARNLFVADEGPDIHERVRTGGTVVDNWTATSGEELGLRDPGDPTAGLADDAPALEAVPGFEALPLEHVGRD